VEEEGVGGIQMEDHHGMIVLVEGSHAKNVYMWVEALTAVSDPLGVYKARFLIYFTVGVLVEFVAYMCRQTQIRKLHRDRNRFSRRDAGGSFLLVHLRC
jgi:hypothetical protein